MPIDLVTRAEWHARAPKGAYTSLSRTRGVKVHYTGGRVDPRIIDDHNLCTVLVRDFQDFHMDGHGWLDLAYSMVACPHRKVFVGRGPGHLCAANGPGLNTGHYAVLGLVGNSGLIRPPDLLLLAILDAIAYLREHGGAGREIKGHRDGYSTDCPGGPLYAWVKRGAPRPGDKPARPVPGDVDEQPVPDLARPLRVTSPMMHGPDVKVWQEHARAFVPELDVDGWYGPTSSRACEAIQHRVGIPVTGDVDDETWLLTLVWEPEPEEEVHPS